MGHKYINNSKVKGSRLKVKGERIKKAHGTRVTAVDFILFLVKASLLSTLHIKLLRRTGVKTAPGMNNNTRRASFFDKTNGSRSGFLPSPWVQSRPGHMQHLLV
jgi:hypothetical protein